MRSILTTVLLGIMVAVPVGCARDVARTDAPETPERVAPVVEQIIWVKGEVFHVEPWGRDRGTLMADLGATDGVQKGDILFLRRDGADINIVDVLSVQDRMFYGLVQDRKDDALLPRVGDTVAKVTIVPEKRSAIATSTGSEKAR